MTAVSNDTRIQRNNVEANFVVSIAFLCSGRGFLWSKTDFPRKLPRTHPRKCGRPRQLNQSNKNYVCDDYIFEFENEYIFVFATEVNEKTIELDTDASQATESAIMRMLEFNESEYTKNLKECSFEEDEAENRYQKDTQENNVTSPRIPTVLGTFWNLNIL